MRYKGTDKPPPKIGRELNIDAVVEGSAVRVGDRVRVTAQLIHAETDRLMWADSYERDFQDLLLVQSEVTKAITGTHWNGPAFFGLRKPEKKEA